MLCAGQLLSARVYLTIAVENSCKEDASSSRRFRRGESPMREHGWGLEIVEQITKEHEGSFSLKRVAPAAMRATAVLKCVKFVGPRTLS